MARVSFVCPLDGTSLGGVNEVIQPVLKGDPLVDPHVHLTLSWTLTCQQGHTWALSADLVFEKR